MPSTLQWCRCDRFRGRNLAGSVAVRRRFRAGVGVFCQTLTLESASIIVTGLENRDVALPIVWGWLAYAERRQNLAGFAVQHSAGRHRYAPFRPRSNPPASDLMTVQAFSRVRPHRLSSRSSPCEFPRSLHLQNGLVQALIANGSIAGQPPFVHPRQDRNPLIPIVVDPHLGLVRMQSMPPACVLHDGAPLRDPIAPTNPCIAPMRALPAIGSNWWPHPSWTDDPAGRMRHGYSGTRANLHAAACGSLTADSTD